MWSPELVAFGEGFLKFGFSGGGWLLFFLIFRMYLDLQDVRIKEKNDQITKLERDIEDCDRRDLLAFRGGGRAGDDTERDRSAFGRLPPVPASKAASPDIQ